MLTIQLNTAHHMMVESLEIGTEQIESPDIILTKENKDVNLWDNEW